MAFLPGAPLRQSQQLESAQESIWTVPPFDPFLFLTLCSVACPPRQQRIETVGSISLPRSRRLSALSSEDLVEVSYGQWYAVDRPNLRWHAPDHVVQRAKRPGLPWKDLYFDRTSWIWCRPNGDRPSSNCNSRCLESLRKASMRWSRTLVRTVSSVMVASDRWVVCSLKREREPSVKVTSHFLGVTWAFSPFGSIEPY